MHGSEDMSWATEVELQAAQASQRIATSFPRWVKERDCPKDGCLGRVYDRPGLRHHFMWKHPSNYIRISEEGGQFHPKCHSCGMQVSPSQVNHPVHPHAETLRCREGTDRKARRELAATIRAANEVTIEALGTDLEKVLKFCYLGRPIAANNSDWPALYHNLQKAKAKWGMIARPLVKTGVRMRTVGLFYMAIVQAVLLFGCETWVITDNMLAILDSFHHRVARKIANMVPKLLMDGSWQYPDLREAMRRAGLQSMETYIRRRQQTLVQYIAGRPIYQLCMEATTPENVAGGGAEAPPSAIQDQMVDTADASDRASSGGGPWTPCGGGQ